MRIEFVEIRHPPSSSGGQRAGSWYIFEIDDKEVAVSVSRRVSRFGEISPQKIRRAVKVFLEEEVERQGLKSLRRELNLDATRMDSIMDCLELNERS